MIKAILFDYDGTLSNRLVNVYLMMQEMLKPFFEDYDEMEFEAVVQDMLLYDQNGTASFAARTQGLKEKYPHGEQIEQLFHEQWMPNMVRNTLLKEDALEVLDTLKGKYKLGLVTNGSSYFQREKVKHVGIEDYFDEILVSGDLQIHKPDVRIFDEMARRLGVKNEECVFVGDTFSADILGAYRAKMHPVWIINNLEKYTKLNIPTIRHLKELIGILREFDEQQ